MEKTISKFVLPLMVIFALVLGACVQQATPAPQTTEAPKPIEMLESTPMPALNATPEPTEAPQTIVAVAVADGRFKTLEAAGLVDTLEGEGPFSVFALTDDAFAKLPAGTVEGLLKDIPQLNDFLLYHVVPGKVMASDVVKLDGQIADTALEGKQLGIMLGGDRLMLNENTQVVITDIETANGFIHVIDAVLLPPAE